MTFEQLKTFIAVYQSGNYPRAAEQLFIPQPTISHRIQQLEKELGYTLMIRGKGEIKLTREGELFLPYALKTIDTIEQGKHLLANLQNSTGGVLRIGSSNTFCSSILPKVLISFSERFPNTTIKVHSYYSKRIIQYLKNKDIEIAITRYSFNDESLHFHPISDERIDLIVSKTHPFATRKTIALSEILEQPLILFEQETRYRQILEFSLNHSNVTFHVKYETNNFELLKELVRSNLGVSFFPSSFLKTELFNDELISIPISDNPFPSGQTFLAYRKGELNEIESLFIREFIRFMGNK